MILSLTSDSITKPRMYDVADSILAQKLSQVPGVGQVFVGGGARPAVRAEINPTLLNKLGMGVEQVQAHWVRRMRIAPKASLKVQSMPGRSLPTIRSLKPMTIKPLSLPMSNAGAGAPAGCGDSVKIQ